MKYHYLDKINFPSDLRKFKRNELSNISEELRQCCESFICACGITPYFFTRFTIMSHWPPSAAGSGKAPHVFSVASGRRPYDQQ